MESRGVRGSEARKSAFLVLFSAFSLFLLVPLANALSATGGTITNITGYTVHTFTGNGTFNVTGSGTVEVLVIAGGGSGGGGNYNGGGGGAGGLLYNASYPVGTGSYTVTVGLGGPTAGSSSNGINGQNSSFGNLTAVGGGGGGRNTGSDFPGLNGGSGGGGALVAGNGTAGQGYAGGTASGATGGGGGGCDGIGGVGAGSAGGNGGAGCTYNLTGTATCYAGGGGGSKYLSGSPGNGTCGGGNGSLGAGSPGTNGTGGGGGGAERNAPATGGAGGSGIVIIRYTSAVNIPSWVAPTPSDGGVNNTQVVLNASCDAGLKVYLWFDENNPPTTLRLSNSSTGEYTTNVSVNAPYYYRAACYNATSATFSANTTTRSWIYDFVAPAIVFNPSNGFNAQNFSLVDQYGDSLPLNFTFTDDHQLYAFEVNITNGAGATVWNFSNSSLSGTSYTYATTLNVSNWTAGRYYVYVAVSDSHTRTAIGDYAVHQKKNALEFVTEELNTIEVSTEEDADLLALKDKDRYKFAVSFKNKAYAPRVFHVRADKPIIYLPNSSYRAHFVVSNGRAGQGGNWIDFEGVPGPYNVSKVNDRHYVVSFEAMPSEALFQSIGGLNVLNRTWSWYRGVDTLTVPYAVKGDPFVMALNFTTDATQTFSVGFSWNGSARSVNSSNASGWIAYTSQVLSLANGTYPYVWTVNVTQSDGNVSNFTLSGNLTINEWQIDACTGFTSRRVRWNLANEDAPGSALSGTMQVYVEYYPSDRANMKTFNYTYGAANFFELCVSPANLSMQMDIYAQHVVTGGYTHRFYVQNGTFAGGVQTNYSIYNFNSTSGMSQLRITARHNADYTYYLNVLAVLQRRYVGEGVFRTVQMDKSGDYGLLYFNVKEAVNDYRLLFYDENNSLLLATQPVKFACTANVCDLTQLLDEATTAAAASNLSANYSYDNVTKLLTVSWTGAPLNTTTVDVLVTKETMAGQNTVCTASQTGVGGSYACNLSQYNGAFFVDVRSSGDALVSEWLSVPAPSLGDYMEPEEQSLWSFGIAATIVFGVGLASPVAALIAGVIALVALLFLGILSPLTLTGILVCGAVAAYLGVRLRT